MKRWKECNTYTLACFAKAVSRIVIGINPPLLQSRQRLRLLKTNFLLLITFITLLSACISNTPKANKTNDKIIGVWKDENSTMTYAEDRKWYGQWDTGMNREGHWEVKGDTLWMYAENGFTVMAFYKILKMTETDFEILSLEKDGIIFHKTRVQ